MDLHRKRLRMWGDAWVSWSFQQAWPRIREKVEEQGKEKDKEERGLWERLKNNLRHLLRTLGQLVLGRPNLEAKQRGPVRLTVLAPSHNKEAAKMAMWKKAPKFVPPFQVCMAPYSGANGEGAFILIYVTHMLSDGYSIVGLFADLAEIINQKELTEAYETKIC